MKAAVFLALVLAATAFGELIKLNDDNFDAKLSEISPVMIKFFAPWCGHCKKLAPIWEDFAKTAEGVMSVAEVDCTVATKTCGQMKIRGYPTVKLFDGSAEGSDVNCPRDVASYVQWAEVHVKSKDLKGKFPGSAKPAVPPPAPSAPADAPAAGAAADSKVVILTDANFEEVVATGVTLVKFFAPWCGHCKKLAPTWVELSKYVGDAFRVAEVDCTVNSQICQKYGIRGYPTVKMFEAGQPAVDYSGQRTLPAFVGFVLKNVKTTDLAGKVAVPEQPKAAADPRSAEDEPAPADTAVLQLTPANYEAELAKAKAAGKPMLIKFYAPWCGHCKRLAPIWEDLAKQQKEKGEFIVAKINADKENTLASKYGIQGFPTVFYVNGAEKAEYQGERTVEAFTKFALDHIAASKPADAAHSEL